VLMTGAADNTTPTDSRSRRNRASRRGGQLTTRARSSSYRSACPHLRAPGASVPDGRTIRCGYSRSQQDVGSAPLIPVNNVVSATRDTDRNNQDSLSSYLARERDKSGIIIRKAHTRLNWRSHWLGRKSHCI